LQGAKARDREQSALVAELTEVVAAQKARLKAAVSSSTEAAQAAERQSKAELEYLRNEVRTLYERIRGRTVV
jgi:hypothetical protein